ncbi:hypothetical protein K438DRAFT_1454634, partial [Mycena galopus ATCC 62051]
VSMNDSDLLNPLTPLAFIPPNIAYLFQVAIYIYVGTLGAMIWDVLSNLHNDYKLLMGHKVGIATAAYFVSRFSALLYTVISTLYNTYPLKNCPLWGTLEVAASSIAVSANSLLFFLRARAIFNRNPYLRGMFCVMWLSVVGSAVAMPFSVFGGNVGPTPYCTFVSAKPYASAIGVTLLIHDTTVFLAISWRLFGNSHSDYGFKRNMRAFLAGEYLPRFSKALLKDGQIYYLSTVLINLLNLIMFYNQERSDSYRTMFTVCNVMITNCLACLVFRNTK